jgi:hypothetical protein
LNTFSLDSFQVKMGQILHMSRILQVLWKDETKLQGTKFHPNAFFKEIGGPSPQIFIHCAILSNVIQEWRRSVWPSFVEFYHGETNLPKKI